MRTGPYRPLYVHMSPVKLGGQWIVPQVALELVVALEYEVLCGEFDHKPYMSSDFRNDD